MSSPINAAGEQLVACVTRVLHDLSCLCAHLDVVWDPLEVRDGHTVTVFDGGQGTVLHYWGVIQLGIGVKYGLVDRIMHCV